MCFLIRLSRVDSTIPLALIGKLPEGGPVFDVSGSEDSVAHFRLMFLGLVTIAEAPTSRTDILRVVVSVVVNQHLAKVLDGIL